MGLINQALGKLVFINEGSESSIVPGKYKLCAKITTNKTDDGDGVKCIFYENNSIVGHAYTCPYNNTKNVFLYNPSVTKKLRG